MKQFRVLFILLAGMASFTAVATTSLPEQKPEATLVLAYNQSQEVEKVVSVEFFAYNVGNYKFYLANDAKNPFKDPKPNPNTQAIVTDVGWFIAQGYFPLTMYKEKLNGDYLPDIEKELTKLGIKHSRGSC